jgi:hypothetical protein
MTPRLATLAILNMPVGRRLRPGGAIDNRHLSLHRFDGTQRACSVQSRHVCLQRGRCWHACQLREAMQDDERLPCLVVIGSGPLQSDGDNGP